jgi:3-oxoacyl-[acyl-carrier protein] reductase
MSDILIDNPTVRKLIKQLGLPLPLPQKLARDKNPWAERPLQNETVVYAGPKGTLAKHVADVLCKCGADTYVDPESRPVFGKSAEAWGRRTGVLDNAPENLKPHALVFDGTGIKTPSELREVYDFFHPRIRSLKKCGRLIVLARPADMCKDAASAAAAQALEGFVRSAGRELGRKGATANLVNVESRAEAKLAPVLRFLLSKRSAYVTGQPLRVSKTVKAPEKVPVTRPLEGKVALVTGAARGIGEATAKVLAREGAHVICLDRPEDDRLASKVNAEIDGTLLLCDISADDSPAKIANTVKERFEGIDIVVHNAGITRDRTLAKMDTKWWDQTLDVNLAAVIRVTSALEPLLKPNARIVCLSSIAGISGNVGQTNYAASKAGIIGYVRALAPTLAKKGVAVNAVAPGFIETRLTAAIPLGTREVARRLANLSQGGLPVDIGEVVAFLASPGAAGLSGQIVRVCGGNFVGA